MKLSTDAMTCIFSVSSKGEREGARASESEEAERALRLHRGLRRRRRPRRDGNVRRGHGHEAQEVQLPLRHFWVGSGMQGFEG